VDDLWATKSEDVGLIVHAISFQNFNLCGPDPPTSQTDGRTDGRHAIARPHFALYVVHHAVKQTKKETLQWQTGYSPRPPTSFDRNTVWHGEWSSSSNYKFNVSSTSSCDGSNFGSSHYLGQWLIQQLYSRTAVINFIWGQTSDWGPRPSLPLLEPRLPPAAGVWILVAVCGCESSLGASVVRRPRTTSLLVVVCGADDVDDDDDEYACLPTLPIHYALSCSVYKCRHVPAQLQPEESDDRRTEHRAPSPHGIHTSASSVLLRVLSHCHQLLLGSSVPDSGV